MSSFIEGFKTLEVAIDPVLVFDSHAKKTGPVAFVLLVQITIDFLDPADIENHFVRCY